MTNDFLKKSIARSRGHKIPEVVKWEKLIIGAMLEFNHQQKEMFERLNGRLNVLEQLLSLPDENKAPAKPEPPKKDKIKAQPADIDEEAGF